MITTVGSATAEQAKAEKTTRSEEDRLKEACQGFEAIFMHQLLKSMRAATLDGGLVKKSNAEKIFTDMLDQEMAEIESKNSRNGIADLLFDQLKKTLTPERPGEDKEGSVPKILPGAYTTRRNENTLEISG